MRDFVDDVVKPLAFILCIAVPTAAFLIALGLTISSFQAPTNQKVAKHFGIELTWWEAMFYEQPRTVVQGVEVSK